MFINKVVAHPEDANETRGLPFANNKVYGDAFLHHVKSVFRNNPLIETSYRIGLVSTLYKLHELGLRLQQIGLKVLECG